MAPQNRRKTSKGFFSKLVGVGTKLRNAAFKMFMFKKSKQQQLQQQRRKALQDFFSKLHGSTCSGLDIGGTLTKMVYFRPQDQETSTENGVLSGHGTLYLEHFETWKLERFLKSNNTKGLPCMRSIGATGGGARKLGQELDAIGLTIGRIDELTSLVKGIDFLSRRAEKEIFKFSKGLFQGGAIQRPFTEKMTSKEIGFLPEDPVTLTNNFQLYPYLIVNMGSGTSILRVSSPTDYKRVGGTSAGGSHFLALSRLFAKCKSFDQAIQLAIKGDSSKVDLLVGDIYGGNYAEVGLAATTIASSLGKLVRPEWKATAKRADVLKSLLLSETNEIGHLACLYADQTNVTRIMFTGGFCQGYQFVMQLLAVAVEFRSKGTKEAIFLRHSAHGGAVGALLASLQA